MRHLNIALILSGILFAIVTRIIMPFGKVFTDHGIALNTPDAYVMVRYADMVPNIPAWDYFSGFPQGSHSLGQQVFPLLLSILSSSFNVSVYAVAAVLPVILFFLSLLAVYTIAKTLFSTRVAVIAIFLLCLMPGEILNRTSLGASDYHCWEIFLVSNIMMVIIVALDSHSSLWKTLLFIEAGILFTIYYFSWAGALVVPAILALAVAVFVFFKYCKTTSIKQAYGMVIMGLAAMALRIGAIGGPVKSMLFLGIQSTTAEENPLFFTLGRFDMAPMIAYFGITFFIVLAGIGWLLYRVIKFRKPGEIVFLSWTIVMLFLIIAMRRFDYYFAINAAIIVAYVTVKLFQIIGSRQAVRLAIVVAIVFCLPLAKQSIVTASSDYGYATQDWARTAQYLKEQNTPAYEKAYSTGERPPYGVFSWWSYGYWLMSIGHQAVYTNNGGGNYRNNAKILLSQDYDYVLNQLQKNKMRYVVICEDMFKSHGLSTDNLEQTFMYKAYYQQINDLYLVCQYGDVKTFEIKEAIK